MIGIRDHWINAALLYAILLAVAFCISGCEAVRPLIDGPPNAGGSRL